MPGQEGDRAEPKSRTEGGPIEVTSVYVHAPFCVRRCVYCDFAVTVSATGDPAGWAESLEEELAHVEREGLLRLAPLLETVYVGGGTPSLLGPGAMRSLRDLLGPARLRDPALEWTAEANPESFDPALATSWREAGVTRVSLGVQSFHAPTLRWMGRLHGPEGAEAAVTTAKAGGFENVSVDLIFGLPERVGRIWRHDLDRALALDVPHVSLYGLSVESATPLGRAVAEGRESPVDEERYREEFLEAAARLGAAGYEHYEVSNFARPGFASRHNAAYWDGRPYLGLGNGAHSYAHPVRRWNVRDWGEYRTRLARGDSPEESREQLGAEATALEEVWLGLRTGRGLATADWGADALALVSAWERAGLAVAEEGRARLTPTGWLGLDGLSVELERARARDTRRRSASPGLARSVRAG